MDKRLATDPASDGMALYLRARECAMLGYPMRDRRHADARGFPPKRADATSDGSPPRPCAGAAQSAFAVHHEAVAAEAIG